MKCEPLTGRGKHFKNKKLEIYQEALEGFRKETVEPGPPSEAAVSLYRRIERYVRELGATTIFVTQPALYLQSDLIKAHERGDVAYLLRYDSPELFPEFYDPENRWDDTHLNETGAKLFTERLAQDVADLIDRAGLRR